MKRIVPICLVLLFLGISGFRIGSSEESVTHEKLSQLKKEVTDNLTKNILPYWTSKMTDNINGGFYGRIDADEKVYPDAEKGGILNARILWTYSSAYRVLKDPEYLRMATRAKEYILKYFIDNDHGGTYRSLTATGEPSDTRKQIYSQAFFVYALSEY
ncbi:MAG TPA: AGE family epimerase/isomerase, partial [Bacteroidales bacterium]|nr:AGE family epimerase/isomerase [Bacteroidales bacterium]